MRSRRPWWIVFGACTALVVLALVWMTVVVTRLERAEGAARADAVHQESLRLALWRMDSWFSPHLARESARPYDDYRSFRPPELAYTKMLRRLEAQEVLTPSPLLSFESGFIRLHFEVAPDGTINSPQVPAGNERDLVEATYVSGDRLADRAATLAALQAVVTPGAVETCVAVCDAAASSAPAAAPAIGMRPDATLPSPLVQRALTEREAGQRQLASLNTNEPAAPPQWLAPPAAAEAPDGADPPAAVVVEPLVPVWLDGTVAPGSRAAEPGARELIFVRRVLRGPEVRLQGFLCDWPALRAALLATVDDLFPRARLVPVLDAPARATGAALATIPARLDVAAAAPPAMALLSPARGTLALTWLAVLGGLAAVAVTLRASIASGERRARFASAVTHELRTPLTTFRMYSEMLAEGMVRTDEQRRAYLVTLRDEADRLAALVENVLAYARLERGHARIERAPTALGALLERLRPRLAERAERAGMRLEASVADADRAARLVTDAEAVGQILLNLVENAGKYAADAADRTIHVEARVAGDRVEIDVRDHGAGIPPEHARTVFAPFERGARSAGDPTPGVGLGLALARGLARTLGGDLRLRADGAAGGACFRLALPGRPRRNSGHA